MHTTNPIILLSVILALSLPASKAQTQLCSVPGDADLPACVEKLRSSGGGVVEITAEVQLTEALNLDNLSNVDFVGTQDAPVVISGGVRIPLSPCSNFQDLLCGDLSSIKGLARHLYFDGVRHSRPKASANIVALFTAESTTVSTSSYTIDTKELDSRLVKTVALWSENVEMVYTGQGSPWSESRCAVSSVDATESTLTVNMKTPCFDTLQNKPCGQSTSTPVIIENTGLADLLSSDDENSFWVDAKNSRVYVKTSTSQSSFAVIPDLETLVSGSNVRSITFKNLSFEHATYNQATAPAGFIEQQSGALVYEPVTNSR